MYECVEMGIAHEAMSYSTTAPASCLKTGCVLLSEAAIAHLQKSDTQKHREITQKVTHTFKRFSTAVHGFQYRPFLFYVATLIVMHFIEIDAITKVLKLQKSFIVCGAEDGGRVWCECF